MKYIDHTEGKSQSEALGSLRLTCGASKRMPRKSEPSRHVKSDISRSASVLEGHAGRGTVHQAVVADQCQLRPFRVPRSPEEAARREAEYVRLIAAADAATRRMALRLEAEERVLD